jgi:biopolymer transport protein ExbB/TolQ
MRIITLLVMCAFLSLSAYAEIYRWTDAQGRVHFGEQPRQGAERVEVSPQILERDDQVREREANMHRLQQVRSEERAMKQQQKSEEQARLQANCDRLNNELARFDKRMYWYEEDASGKKVEVKPDRVEEQEMQLQALIRERC